MLHILEMLDLFKVGLLSNGNHIDQANCLLILLGQCFTTTHPSTDMADGPDDSYPMTGAVSNVHSCSTV